MERKRREKRASGINRTIEGVLRLFVGGGGEGGQSLLGTGCCGRTFGDYVKMESQKRGDGSEKKGAPGQTSRGSKLLRPSSSATTACTNDEKATERT